VKTTYIDANAMSIPALPQSTHGRACERPFVVVRHPHVHYDIRPRFVRLLQLDSSTLMRAPGDEIECIGRDGQNKRRLGALGETWRPTRSGLVRGPIETSNRFFDPAVFSPRNADRPTAEELSTEKQHTWSATPVAQRTSRGPIQRKSLTVPPLLAMWMTVRVRERSARYMRNATANAFQNLLAGDRER